MPPSQRIAIGIEYDGGEFKGWQMQSHGVRVVQAEIERSLSMVADHPVSVVCAGRTDSGVHATHQVAHFDTTSIRENKAWVLGVNNHLPDDVSLVWSKPVDETFNARFSATLRSYRYVILDRKSRCSLFHRRVCWSHDDLDVAKMHQAAQALLGKQDFSAFRSSNCQAKSAVRIVKNIDFHKQDKFIYMDISANAFLHHMVRNIVGSLLLVGNREKPVQWVKEVLAQKDRTQAGPTAPAGGLYLIGVQYPDQYDLPRSGIIPVFTSA